MEGECFLKVHLLLTLMELKEVLENYNPHWFSEVKPKGIPRQRYLKVLEKELKEKRITFLVGLRRIGKTTLLKHFISFLQHSIEPTRILYLSLDHPLLQKHNLGDVIREFRKMNEISRKEKVYVFLDEIMYVENAFQWLKVLHDSENIKIYATSSSSLNLKDKKAFLTGRHITIRVKPLSFSEYLIFRGKKTKEPHLLERYFEEYLRDGGIPEYVLSRDASYLVGLAEDIIARDIGSQANISNLLKLTELFLLLVSHTGKMITYSKLSKLLGIKQETVEQYISYLTSSELVHLVYRWAKSFNERVYSPKKVYLGDVGFRYALTGKYSSGSNLENLVFLDIMEKEPFYYFEKGVEIDFITKSKEVFECKLREINENQKRVLEKFKRRGYKIHIVRGYRDFI